MNKPNPKKPDDSRKRIELCNWNETLHATALNKTDHYSMKAKCRGTLDESAIARRAGIDPNVAERLLAAVGEAVREGYDVKLCGAVRFYAVVLKLKTPVIVAQTMGGFRNAVADKAIRPTLHGKEVSLGEVRKLDRKAREEHPHITPDTMITCNACGNVMRLGKVLV